MKFDVYCDESNPDLLSSKHSKNKYMIIGSLWLATDAREMFKNEIKSILKEHDLFTEYKWSKVSHSKFYFYKKIIEWFFEKNNQLRFRCIAVERAKINLLHYHDNDQELGFYKFYYQLIHHWITDFNEFNIFCDFKSTRKKDRLHTLHKCLINSNLSAKINNLQAVKSDESILLQLADVLTGIVASKLNYTVSDNSPKQQLIKLIEKKIGRAIAHTYPSEKKFNVFIIKLDGGWE